MRSFVGEIGLSKECDGTVDHSERTVLVDFVNYELSYLAGFKQSAESAQTIEYKIGEIFSEVKNKSIVDTTNRNLNLLIN